MAVTPPEEIARQHAEACKIIESQAPCAPRINHGEVPLHWKERPTSSTPTPIVTAADNGLQSQSMIYTCSLAPNSPDESVEVCASYPDWCISSREFLFSTYAISFYCALIC